MRSALVSSMLALSVLCAARTATHDATTASAIAQDSLGTHLETSCGGGVTGGGGGTIVLTRGDFYRWSQPGPQASERVLSLVRRDSAHAATLFRAAEQRGLTRIKFSEPFNMTCALALVRGGQRYEVAWPLGTTPPQIRELVALAKEIDAAARSR